MHARADDASGAGEDIYLLISTPQTTPFDVTITDGAGNALFAPVSVSRSSPASLTLSSASGASKGTGTKFLVTGAQLATVLSDEGLILTANKAFFASIRVDESAQAESITSKGTAGFGTEFRSGHIWNDGGANNLKAHVISFIATEDNTTVTVSDFGGVDFENVSEGGGSIVVILNEGQSYVLAAYADQTPDNVNEVNGTRISSDKPIVVNSGSWLAGSPGGILQGRDIGVDQIAPIEETGFEYILVKGEGTTSENVIAVAGIDGTNLFVNGSSTPVNSSPLNAGEYYRLTATDYTANENMYIQSNQPVYIYQGLNGVADSNERQFGLNYVPPIVCLGGTNVDLPDIDQLGTPVIQVIGETGEAVTITDQFGVTTDISSLAKSVTGKPEYVTYKVTGYTGDITVESPRPLRVALTAASGNIGAAGFFSGFTTAPVVESPNGYGSTTCIPDNLPVTLTASGFDNFQWYRDGIELPGETAASLSVTSPGLYTAAGKLSGCVPSVQSFPLTISLCPGDVGTAKNAVSINNVSGSVFDVVFDVVLTNYSTTNPAPNVQLVDDLTSGLPAGASASLQG
ncbi:MAG TPA: IgGFc-binding protein, partial [Cyclobacteriaceae bacterium]